MSEAFIIYPQTDGLRVACATKGQCRWAVAESNAAIRTALEGLGYRGQAVMLALPSRLYLCASVDAKGLTGRNRRAGLLFRLEEQLPLSLEELTADFIGESGTVLGVAIATSSIKPLVQTLEDQRIPIAAICPTALLVASELCHILPKPPGAVACQMGGGIDWMLLEHGQVVNWTLTVDVGTQAKAALLFRKKLSVHAINLDSSLREGLASICNVESNTTADPLELASSAAWRVLVSGSSPPLQLRRGDLAGGDPLRAIRTPLRAAVAAAVLLAFCVAASMFWRAAQFSHLADAARLRQQQAFHAALPDQVPPPSIVTRLLSEQKRLAGLAGTNSPVQSELSVLPLLRNTLASLPSDLRYRLLELRFEPQRLYLEGQTLDHGGADILATALGRGTGLQVDPPHTEQPTGQNVDFTLTASSTTGGP